MGRRRDISGSSGGQKPPRQSSRKEAALTPRERLFAHEYIRHHGNGTKAAIAAGYSEASAAELASRLLRKSKVAELVQRLNTRALERIDSKAQEVLDELRHVGLARLSRVVKSDGTAKPLEEWGEHELAALSKLEVDERFANPFAGLGRLTDDGLELPADEPKAIGRTVKAEMSGKLKALELLAKHHRLIDEKVEHQHTGAVTLLVDPYAAPKGEEAS